MPPEFEITIESFAGLATVVVGPEKGGAAVISGGSVGGGMVVAPPGPSTIEAGAVSGGTVVGSAEAVVSPVAASTEVDWAEGAFFAHAPNTTAAVSGTAAKTMRKRNGFVGMIAPMFVGWLSFTLLEIRIMAVRRRRVTWRFRLTILNLSIPALDLPSRSRMVGRRTYLWCTPSVRN
jgi:hypothetical protein